jgi:hypothetical protein
MPGEMAAHDDIGDLADARIRKTFTTQEAEPLEEISEVEEIREGVEDVPAPPPEAAAEIDLEPTSLRTPAPPKPSATFDELSEIEVVEVPGKAPEPPPPPAPPVAAPARRHPPPPSFTVSADEEGSGLTFLKFEAPFIAPEGHAVLPALFVDAAGNPVLLRIRVTMDGE